METSRNQANTIPLLAVRMFDLFAHSSPPLRQVSCCAKLGGTTVLSVHARGRSEAKGLVGCSQDLLKDRPLGGNQDIHVRAVLARPQSQLFCRRSPANGPSVSF